MATGGPLRAQGTGRLPSDAAELPEVLAQLDAVQRRIERSRFLSYAHGNPGEGGASEAQREFSMSPARKRGLVAGNDTGKTYAGSFEAWCHLAGRHPWVDLPAGGSDGWALLPDLTIGWKTACHAMRELEPRGWLDPNCHYIDGIGYTYRSRQMVKIRDKMGGHIMMGRGCNHPPTALEGSKIGWLWVDEPSKEPHWNAARARLVDMGRTWLTFTAVNRPCRFLRLTLEGIPDEGKEALEPDWVVWHAEYNYANAPHRSREEVDRRRAECPPHQKAQRIYAQWEGTSIGRWIPAFHDDLMPTGHLFTDTQGPARSSLVFGLGWDHGERPGAEANYLAAFDGFRVWVLGEYISEPGSGPADHVEGTIALLDTWGVRLHEISEARGDTNSGGFLAQGLSINTLLEQAFARRAHLTSPPFRIEGAVKSKNGRRLRANMLSAACLSGRFYVHESCVFLRRALSYWEGADDEYSHPLDAVTYLAQEWLGTHTGGVEQVYVL